MSDTAKAAPDILGALAYLAAREGQITFTKTTIVLHVLNPEVRMVINRRGGHTSLDEIVTAANRLVDFGATGLECVGHAVRDAMTGAVMRPEDRSWIR